MILSTYSNHPNLDDSFHLLKTIQIWMILSTNLNHPNLDDLKGTYKNDKHLEFNFNCSRTYR